MKDKIKADLKEYSGIVSDNCRVLTDETRRCAYFVEDMLNYKDNYDTSIDDMDSRYVKTGNMYMHMDDGNRWLNLSPGAVPLDDRVKKELRLFEYAKPKMKAAYEKARYSDEFWFFTLESLAAGWVDYDCLGPNIPENLDLTVLHGAKVTRVHWFDIVNPVNNPEREGRWTPFPFIELFHQWILCYHYPIYEGDTFKGAFVPHVKIEPMLEDSIYKSKEKMMMIHEDSTLLGMNEAAEKEFNIENYKFREWEDSADKIPYVRDRLNLMKNANPDFVWLADGIKWQKEFELTINGKDYTILTERIPGISVTLVAFLDK